MLTTWRSLHQTCYQNRTVPTRNFRETEEISTQDLHVQANMASHSPQCQNMTSCHKQRPNIFLYFPKSMLIDTKKAGQHASPKGLRCPTSPLSVQSCCDPILPLCGGIRRNNTFQDLTPSTAVLKPTHWTPSMRVLKDAANGVVRNALISVCCLEWCCNRTIALGQVVRMYEPFYLWPLL